MSNTQDWSKFGFREIEMAKELLSHIQEIDSSGQVKVEFNPNSGNVFLVDDDFRVWMMNGEELEEFFNCPYCGHEGFKDDMKHDPEHRDCLDYLKQIDVLSDDATIEGLKEEIKELEVEE